MEGSADCAASLSINDIISPGLEEAVISTYMVDLPWLVRQCPPLYFARSVHLSHGTRSAEDKALLQQSVAMLNVEHNFKLSTPYMPIPYGINHGKLFVLYYDTFVRIAVSSSNLLRVDYERKSQSLWMQDFPLALLEASGKGGNEKAEGMAKKMGGHSSRSMARVEGSSTRTSHGNEKNGELFRETLVDYLRRLKVPYTRLSLYDFSSATAMLITSVPGKHEGTNLHRYGMMRLKKVLSGEELPEEFRDTPLYTQVSSIGSISSKFVKDFLDCCASRHPGSRANPIAPPALRLAWPTAEFVRCSVDGYSAGGSLCFPLKNYKEPLRSVMRQYQSPSYLPHREHVPPHIKTLCRCVEGEVGWAYTGSHNFSAAGMATAVLLSLSHYPCHLFTFGFV